MKKSVLATAFLAMSISDLAFCESLDDISRFSMQICDSIRTEGAISKKEIVGKLDGELRGIAKLIGASVAADGTIRIDDTNYSELPYDDLPAQMQDARACRKEIAKLLLVERKKIKNSPEGSNSSSLASTKEPAEPRARQDPKSNGSVFVPSDVESMWVFYQDPANQSVAGCRRPPNADPIEPKEFQQRIGEFISNSNATGSQLIITAYSPSRGWDAATSDIRVNNKSLTPTKPYWCNGKRYYGYQYK